MKIYTRTGDTGETALFGEADAFGHRKLGGLGQELGEGIKGITGEGVRTHLLLLDDVCNRKNTLHEPASRKKVLRSLRGYLRKM